MAMAADLELPGYGGHGTPAQAVALVGTPAYPNSIKWSEENLIAVSSGHLVTILSPASLTGPRGFVPIVQSPIFDVGKVQYEDFHDPELMQFRLAREGRVCVRSLDWSPQGLASHGGCLLAVCTTDSRVKLYRAPFCDYRPEWVEVGDVTELMYLCCVENEFQEAEVANGLLAEEDAAGLWNLAANSHKRGSPTQEPQHRKVQRTEKINGDTPEGADGMDSVNTIVVEGPNALDNTNPAKVKEDGTIERSLNPEEVGSNLIGAPSQSISSKDVPENLITSTLSRCNGEGHLGTQLLPRRKTKKQISASQDEAFSPKRPYPDANRQSSTISPMEYVTRSYSLAPLVVAWSPTCHVNDRGFVFCAVGSKAGSVWLLRIAIPEYYSVEIPVYPEMSLLGETVVHKSWVTTLSWGACPSRDGILEDTLVLATGSADGSVKLWSGNSQMLSLLPSGSRTFPLTLLKEVVVADHVLVSSLALIIPTGASSRLLLAVGKGSGQISAWEFNFSWTCTQMVNQQWAHDQVVTGLTWTTDGRFLYSCGQDNMLHVWDFSGSNLFGLPFPESSSLLTAETPQISIDLPSSVLDPYYGVALSPGTLSMAVVRGITADMIDQMYQARAQKGVVHLFWVGCQKSKTLLDQTSEQGGEKLFHKTVPLDDLANWRIRILSILHHMEDPKQPLVLWDIVAALASLKPVTDAGFITSVILDWVSTWCRVMDSRPTDTSYIAFDILQASLPFASCRQLQVFCVLYRQLLLAHCRPQVLSRRTSLEQVEPAGEKVTYVGRAAGHALLSPEEDNYLKQHLWSVEHELRQRLFLGTLSAAGCLETTEQLENRLGDMEVVMPLIVDWVLANRSESFPNLVQLAESRCTSSNDMLSSSGKSRSLERCTFCDADVPLESPEIAYCNSVESKKGKSKHKLQRCSVSLQVCPGSPLWYCSCCARWASALAPASFFSLSSRTFLEHASLPLIQQTPVPACPYCGILMHRFLPEFLLSPTLV